jgi:ribosomal protein L37E
MDENRAFLLGIFIVLLVILVISIFVYNDAKQRGRSKVVAFLWLIGTFFLFIPIFPLWIIVRNFTAAGTVSGRKAILCANCGKYYEGTPSYCPNCGNPIKTTSLRSASDVNERSENNKDEDWKRWISN